MPTSPVLRLIHGGRTDGDGRQSVDLYRHDTGEVHRVVWRLPTLLAAIRRRRPRKAGDPEWSFAVGPPRHGLVVMTDGPGRFHAQRALRGDDGLIAEVTAIDDLTLHDVERMLGSFYAGEPLDSRPAHNQRGECR
jgi:hypothetical protein